MKTLFTCSALLLVINVAVADLNGSDDFNDNVIDTTQWAVDGAMAETNSRLEYVGGGTSYAEGALAWIANEGSYTNDWRVSIDVVNAVEETSLSDQFVCYGLAVVPQSAPDTVYSLELRVGDNDGGANPYRHIMTAYDDGEAEVFQYPISYGGDSTRLQISFDASAKVLTSSADSGIMTFLTNYNVSGWGMVDGDEFIIAVFGWSYDVSPASGEVYGDNFSAYTLATHYVDINSINPVPPYTNWVTAATNIQDAIDVAEYGETVLVNDGVYDSGTTTIANMLNRIAITNAITVQSVNGPDHTFIVGQGPLGSDAVRCVYMDSGELIGFTITNGHTRTTGPSYDEQSGGGALCANDITVSTCISTCNFIGNEANYSGGGIVIVTAGTLTINDCILSGNSAPSGGGVCANNVYKYDIQALNNCTLSNNSAYNGGGLVQGYAYNCDFIDNTAQNKGGGIYGRDAYNCNFIGNTADYGGGKAYGEAYNCIFKDNYATNSGNDFYYLDAIMYSCSTQLVHGVDGNITNAPLFVGGESYRLAPNSPCIDAGNNAYVSTAIDLDGNPRIIDGTVDMGAYEAFYVTNSYPSASGFALGWMFAPTGWHSTVQYSTNLVTMPFTDLSAPMPYPINSYTDLVHGADSECFYKVEISP